LSHGYNPRATLWVGKYRPFRAKFPNQGLKLLVGLDENIIPNYESPEGAKYVNEG